MTTEPSINKYTLNKTACSILVLFLSSFSSMWFVSIYVVHPYNSIDTATAEKQYCFILSDRLDFNMIDNLSMAVHTFMRHMLTRLSVDEILLPRYVILSINFRGLPLQVEMAPSHLKYMNSVLFAFTWRPLPPAACSRLCNRLIDWLRFMAYQPLQVIYHQINFYANSSISNNSV